MFLQDQESPAPLAPLKPRIKNKCSHVPVIDQSTIKIEANLPASIAACLAATLSPIRSITSAGGPMNSIPASRTALAKSALSDKNP